MFGFSNTYLLVPEQVSSTSRRTPRKNLSTILAFGTNSYLLAGGQSIEDLIEVVPGRRPNTL
jgi:hypothetical protein